MKFNIVRQALIAGLFGIAGSVNAYAEGTKTALTEDDREFLIEAAADNLEMQAMIKMGLTKGSHTKVKEFSKEISAVHTDMANRIKELATVKGIKLPTALEKDDRMKIDVINALSGLSFDKRFMKEMEDEHTDLIENFEEALRECQDADLKSFAEKSLPVLRDHLAKAKSITALLTGSASR